MHHSRRPTSARLWVLLLSSVFALSLPGVAQTTKDDFRERQHAFELYEQNNFVEAMPLLEKLAADHPDDIAVLERWAFSMVGYSKTVSDPEDRKKVRIRARAIAVRAKALGDNSNLLNTVLDSLPEDGSEHPLSDRKDINEIMQQAEADFASGDLDKARAGYIRALLLDPNYYQAALFAGDALFKQKKPGFAGEWFSRAIQIDPNRETAYRYWGDALMAEGKRDEARSKFIEAVIAEPYSRNSWVGLSQWADNNHVKLNLLQLPNAGSVTSEGDKININININLAPDDKKDDSTSNAAWLAYSLGRALWRGDKFKKEFPNEPKYRHTLREEVDALSTAVTVAGEVTESSKKKKKDAKPLDPALVALVQLKQAGFLEPFVLLNHADQEIVQDYPAYRAAHRDNIRRYLDEYVVPKTPEKPAE